jgi:hypothetical protein
VDFENSQPLFHGVHRSFKFCLLTLGHESDIANFAFFLTDPSQIHEKERLFSFSPEDIAKINPNTKTAPVFRSKKDAEITSKIYRNLPVLIDENEDNGNPWGVEFVRMFDMSNDSHLFRTSKQLTDMGYKKDGTNWLHPDMQELSQNATDLIQGTNTNALDHSSVSGRAKRYVPLYEAKMLGIYNHRFADYKTRTEGRGHRVLPRLGIERLENPKEEAVPYYWVPFDSVPNSVVIASSILGICRATTATTKRTCVATLSPPYGYGDKQTLLFTKQNQKLQNCFYANLNSIVFDYVVRTKLAYLTLSQFILKQLPVLPFSAYSNKEIEQISDAVLELTYTSHSMESFAIDLGYSGAPFKFDFIRRFEIQCYLDALFAKKYGLTRLELEFVLDPVTAKGPDYPSETFRVLKESEIKEFGEYRTRTRILHYFDEFL